MATKTACAIAEMPSASVTCWDHLPEGSEGLTIRVERYTPAAKVAIEARTATAPGPPAPAARNPRNAMFPVMKAVNTLPRARKLIASTAPDETVNAFSNRSRTLSSTARSWIVVTSSVCMTRTSAPYQRRLARRDLGEDGLVDVQVRSHQFVGRELQPLCQRDVGEVVAPEDFQESQRRRADILDVMTHRKGHGADVPCLEVEGACGVLRREHGHPRLARDVVLPLVHIRVPVQLAHTARFHLDQGGRDRLRRLEDGGIGDADGSAVHADGLLGQHPEAEGIGYRAGAGDSIRHERTGHGSLEDPEVLLRDAIERALRHAEVLGQNFFRRVSEPVAEQERFLL